MSHFDRIKGHMNNQDIINLVTTRLLTKCGKLSSPKIHSPKNKDVTDVMIEATRYLPTDSSISRRWWHIRNGSDHPLCYCGNNVTWNAHSKFYPTYCCQRCAVTSPEASERTRQQFTNVTISTDRVQRSKQTRQQRGYYKDRNSTVKKLSDGKRGSLNSQYGATPWNKGLTGSANPLTGRTYPDKGLWGDQNPQYGKAPSPQAGRGIKGWYKGVHFRSSLEMFYLMYWDNRGVEFVSAETSEFRVKYVAEDERERTYSPDFFLITTNTLVEIKPERLHTNPNVVKKFSALQRHHPNKTCTIVGFREIAQFIRDTIQTNEIDVLYEREILCMCQIQFNRLKNNYDDIIRSTAYKV